MDSLVVGLEIRVVLESLATLLAFWRMAFRDVSRKFFVCREYRWLGIRVVHAVQTAMRLKRLFRLGAHHAEQATLLTDGVSLMHMPLQCALSLVSIRTPIASLCIHKGARIWLDLHVLRLYVCIQCFLLPERLVAWREVCAVKLGVVYILVSLQSAVGGEALSAAFPIASERSLDCRVAVGILDVALEMVLTWEGLVTAIFVTSKRSLLVVAAHVCFEAAWAVEALVAARKCADVVPLAARLAVCPQGATVRVIHPVVARVVRLPAKRLIFFFHGCWR